MDRSAVKAIVDREIEPLLLAFGLPLWKITVDYGPIGGADPGCRVTGECTRLLDYESASITLDPESLDDEAHALRILRHELMHVVLAPFDLMRSWILTGLEGADHDRAMRLVNHATETGVRNLERFWHGMAERPAAKPGRPKR